MKITIALNEIDADQTIAKNKVETACEQTGRNYDYNGDEVTISNCLYGNRVRQEFIDFCKKL